MNRRFAAVLLCASSLCAGGLEPVTKTVSVYRDSCNVYVVRRGPAAILIDLGSGAVLDELARSGVRVEAIYLTHRDRDQWFGWRKAAQQRIPIYAPAGDAQRFGYTAASIQRYWNEYFPWRAGRWIYNILTEQTDYPSSGTGKGAGLETVPLPGHTTEQVGYIATADGLKVAFSGDALYAAGKVWQGYQLDWDHWRGQGYEVAAHSVLKLRELQPDVIAPSHGHEMRTALDAALLRTAEALWKASQLKNVVRWLDTRPNLAPSRELPRLTTFEVRNGQRPLTVGRLSEHLWIAGNNYFLLAEDGSCFAVDNNMPPALWERVLPRIGAKRVEYIWPTHLHADHLMRYPELKQRYGLKVVTIPEMAAQLEQPLLHWHPYSNYDGIRPDVILRDGQDLEWKGYRLRAHFAPGQTVFHSFLETTVDGRRAVFAGDGYWPRRPERNWYFGTGGWSGLNRGFPVYYARSARLMRRIRPDWVLSSHDQPYEFDGDEWSHRAAWGDATARHFDALSPSGSHLIDFNPHVFSVRPLAVRWEGTAAAVELRVTNPLGEPMPVVYRVDAGGPFRLEPAAGDFTAPPRGEYARKLTLRSTAAPRPGRHVVPLRVTARGVDYGQPAFLLVDVAGAGR